MIKNYVKNISITKIKNNIEVKFYLNQPLNLNYFSITPQDKKGHRFVVDLTTDKIIYTKKINNNKKFSFLLDTKSLVILFLLAIPEKHHLLLKYT